MILVALFVAAQLADVLTWAQMDQSREMNPVVIALGPALALAGKALLTLYCVWYARRFPSVAAQAVLAFGAALGALGAWSNLP